QTLAQTSDTAPAAAIPLQEVRKQIDALERRAADEGTEAGAQTAARMALARFLLQNDFAPEALGALRQAAINQGDMAELDPDFRLMRGEANAMLGRIPAALNDLNASALRHNPAAALWRGYADSEKQDWDEARRELEAGAGAMEQLSPAWRARFQLALAEAA